jgi:hypothetical protein
MARLTRETGKKEIAANDVTLPVTGEDTHGTVMLQGTFTGTIYLDATVTKNLITDIGDDDFNLYGVNPIDMKEKPTAYNTITVEADQYTSAGVFNVRLNDGVQYTLRASADLTGAPTVFLVAGKKYD